MYEFVETCRGRELIFQNYSYLRFCQSNVYKCTSNNPQICFAKVMLEDDKILVISSYHNHLPPFLLRDKNGAIVTSFNLRNDTKPKRKGKPTLGPRATRNEVDSLVASIMYTVKAMENKTEAAAPNASGVAVPVEAEVGPSNEAAPRSIKKRSSVPKTKKEITPENNQASLAVTSTKKNEPLKKVINSSHMNSLLKGTSTNKNGLQQEKNSTGFSQMTPSQDTMVSREMDTVPLLKHDASSLVPNQMYIVVPNVESGIQHNRFILSPPNVGGLLYGNRILVSPIQTEPSTAVTCNNKKIQPMNMRNFPMTDVAMSKKIDINTEVPKKKFFLVQTNNMNTMNTKIDESISFESSNIEPATQNETSALVPNKMLILVHNNNENGSLVSSNTKPKQHISVSEPSYILNSTSTQEIETPNVSCTIPKIQPKRLEMKTSIPIASIKNVIFPRETIESIASPTNMNNVSLKSNDGLAVGNTVMPKKPVISQTILSNIEPKITNKSIVLNDMSVPLVTPKIKEMHNKVETVASIKSETICPFDTNETQTSNVVPEKMIKIAPKKNEINSPAHYRTQQIVPKKAGTSITESSKMRTFVKTENANDNYYDSETLMQLKPETFSAAIGNIKPIATNKIGNANDQITNFDPIVPQKTEVVSINKEQKTQKKTEDISSVSTLPNTVQPKNKMKKYNIRSKMPKQKPMTFMESYMNALEKNSEMNSTVEANTSKKSASALEKINLCRIRPEATAHILKKPLILPVPLQKIKTDSDMTDKLKSKDSKMTVDDENGKIQSIVENMQTADLIETSSSNIDCASIVPKNENVGQPKQAETDFLSNTNTKEIDNNTSSIATNIPDVPIPVSMIPLPKENNSTPPGTMSVASETALVLKETQPLVMIERLPMKHKAGSSNMRTVPLKKRYYQF